MEMPKSGKCFLISTYLQINSLGTFVPVSQTLSYLGNHHFHVIVEQRLYAFARFGHLSKRNCVQILNATPPRQTNFNLLQRMELFVVVCQ